LGGHFTCNAIFESEFGRVGYTDAGFTVFSLKATIFQELGPKLMNRGSVQRKTESKARLALVKKNR
jgi:hypothetical protein